MKLTNLYGKIIDWLKEKFNTGDKKKLVENIVIVIIVGVIIIIAGGAFFSKAPASKPPQEGGAAEVVKPVAPNDSDSTEEGLKNILSQISGAGRVDVMITYVSSREIVPATDGKKSENNSDEKDSTGGTRNVRQAESEESIAYQQEQDGTKTPIVLKNIEPEVRGVVVVADGAGDPVVKEKLSTAVQTLMEVAPHKVQVFERKK